MITSIAVALVLRSPSWEFAYRARHYYPAYDSRISRGHVYLANLNGSRKRLSKDRACDGPHWIDRNTLVWIEVAGASRTLVRAKGPAWKGVHEIRGKDLEFVEGGGGVWIDHAGKKRVLRKATFSPAQAQVVKSGDKYLLRVNGREYRITNPNQDWFVYIDVEGEVRTTSVSSAIDDRRQSVEHLGTHGSKSYFRLTTAANAHVLFSYLIETNAANGTAQALPADAMAFTGLPDKGQFVGWTDRQLRASSGDVWTSTACLIDAKTRTFKQILSGRVDVFHVALRP